MNSKNIVSTSLLFRSHGVKKIEFEVIPPQTFEDEKDAEIALDVNFSKGIRTLTENDFLASLAVQIKGINHKEQVALNLNVCIDGYFTAESTKDLEMYTNVNAITILFPYLRTVVSSITSISNYGEIILPAMNIINWFEKEKENSINMDSDE
ncbi:protein-export chaperone SecB [Methanimicrococcus sp. OttesenSCG-928-J09]|nr:protein-export chaperone SecB [Methanimicrococcus sp. OttesenSCG-928-J09]